jgi:hypothetical protein
MFGAVEHSAGYWFATTGQTLRTHTHDKSTCYLWEPNAEKPAMITRKLASQILRNMRRRGVQIERMMYNSRVYRGGKVIV